MDTENPKTAIEYIHSLGRFTGKPGLHRIKALCEALGNPQDRLKFVHLAGTNGKGSTACMIASALQAAGLRTGLYTSPYLVQFYERIRVDGVMISDDDLTRLCERVTVACESLTLPEGETIGEFEFTTALAFLCFVEQECDIVVLETGLGGRCDATNVIKNAEVCVITPISLDHMAVLGNTTAVIAAEKAGIFKPGAAVVCADGQPNDVQRVLRRACDAAGAVWFGGAEDCRVLRCDIGGSAFVYEAQGYTIAMPGRHQLQNARTALRALNALRERGWNIPTEAAVRGLARARIAGRLERVVDQPLILLDGAHNAAGADALCHAVDELLKMKPAARCDGHGARQGLRNLCSRMVASRADDFYACVPDAGERSLDVHTIAELARQSCKPRCTNANPPSTPSSLRWSMPKMNDCILICGSLYLIGECREDFARPTESDRYKHGINR